MRILIISDIHANDTAFETVLRHSGGDWDFVWGYVEQGVEVCFPQAGRIIFLDARTIPRAMSPLESYRVNGMTCVWIESPGSLILMPAD